MKPFTFILVILFFQIQGIAQDSLSVFKYDNFINLVMKNHPYSYRANLLKSMGESTVTQSRGSFDPKIFGNMDQKYFENKQYYSHTAGGLIIPTWFGLSMETGYTMNDGIYLNPEQRIPNSGLWYAGIRLELGNGLIIDQRRAEFEKAKIYEVSTELEKRIILNRLKRDASVAYWKWNQAYRELKMYQMAFTNANQRLKAIKDAAFFGDRPFIDTVETAITVQNWSLQLSKAKTYFENAELYLEVYLWSDGFTPLEIENAIPDVKSVGTKSLPILPVDSMITNHPYLQINDLLIQQNRIDLQLKKEQLKPKLTLKYNAISEPVNDNPMANYSSSNYSWGTSFSYPILSRKERGGVQLANLKLQDQEFKNKLSAAELSYKINSTSNNYRFALEQLEISKRLVTNNQIMYEAERSLFNLGESSVFMINSRESAWLKAQIENIWMENESYILKSELLFQLMIE